MNLGVFCTHIGICETLVKCSRVLQQGLQHAFFTITELYNSRVVQNQKLVSFVIKNSYRCARCIPYTQITITEKGDKCFANPERLTHWLSLEKFKKISKETEDKRKTLPMIDLTELKFWGEFGMHWRSGSRYEMTSKIKERSIVKHEKTDESLDITLD